MAVEKAPLKDEQGAGDSHVRRALIFGTVWIGFAGGSLLSSVTIEHMKEWTLLPPALVLLMPALFGGK